MSHFQKALELVLRFEGGYSNDPADPGKETKFGISSNSYPKLNIATLTKDEAAAIYKRDYWDKLSLDTVNSESAAAKIFSVGVHCGVKFAKEMTIEAVNWSIGLNRDKASTINNVYLDALADVDDIPQKRFMMIATSIQTARYVILTRNNGNLKKFIFGWLNRANIV